MSDEPKVTKTNALEALKDHPDLQEFLRLIADPNLIVAHGTPDTGNYAMFASPDRPKTITFTQTDDGYTVSVNETEK